MFSISLERCHDSNPIKSVLQGYIRAPDHNHAHCAVIVDFWLSWRQIASSGAVFPKRKTKVSKNKAQYHDSSNSGILIVIALVLKVSELQAALHSVATIAVSWL